MLRIMIAALIALTGCQAATAQTKATPKKHPHHVVVRQEGQIACTKLGCQRIPLNCHPATEYYANGLPTGYDRIACP